ncbi:UrcA family protein [Phenylobacterium sp.]|uniref:UrcA family protein n=1 Tax=Phenylobacterium sp. TaxID=1871053 RepID=UPI002FC77F93
MKSKLIAVVSASAFLGAAFVGTPAFAQEERADMKVAVGDLNLRAGTGAERALRRIKSASKVFCQDTARVTTLQERSNARACRDRMMYLAVNKLDAPLVTARYDESGARPPIILAER